jgi:hypothetical protein
MYQYLQYFNQKPHLKIESRFLIKFSGCLKKKTKGYFGEIE